MVDFELEILSFIRDNLSNPFLDTVMPFITHLGSGGILWIAVAVVMLISKKHRKTGVTIAIALLLSLVVCNGILKPLVNRVRPYDMTSVELLISKPMGASFPSGHTTASFAAAVAIALSRNKIWVFALFAAVLIAFSRMYLYVHYPGDVLFGAILGMLLAFAANWAVNRFYRPKKE